MRTPTGALIASALLALSSAVCAAGAAPDPVIGSWTLNVARSSGAAVPKSDTRTYVEADGGIKLTMKRVTAEGKEISAQTTYKYDGKDYPFTGSPDYDTVSTKRIAVNTVEITQKRGGKVVGKSMRSVSRDGKTLTLVMRSTNAKGQAVSTTLVFDRK
jgi:2',3'-cyclic-nucleotide 2'-phosphodiesterase (5'-nucleotidase family)